MNKQYISPIIFAVMCLLGCLPTILVATNHSRLAKRWDSLNSRILTLKISQENRKATIKQNESLIRNRNNICEEALATASKKILLLQKETARLYALPKDSLLAQSKEVWARKHAITKIPEIQWNLKKLEADLVALSLSQPIEMDNDDISSILYLLDPNKNPEAPLAFFTRWEMTKQITPLNNEVWLVQAEAISRWT